MNIEETGRAEKLAHFFFPPDYRIYTCTGVLQSSFCVDQYFMVNITCLYIIYVYYVTVCRNAFIAPTSEALLAVRLEITFMSQTANIKCYMKIKKSIQNK